MRLCEITQTAKTVVFTFGRFNPPTIGHEVLIDRVKGLANKEHADWIVFVSQKQKSPKDPLSWQEKINLMKRAFPGIHVSTDSEIRTPFDALSKLAAEYQNLILVVGSDRVENFRKAMAPYLEEFGVGSLKVVSAGERDPDADGASGVSASEARKLAMEGKYEEFASLLPQTVSEVQKKKAYNAIRLALSKKKRKKSTKS